MRVFVTGATGFIGRHVVRELLAHNHEVLALAHSDKGADSLKVLDSKVTVHRGTLADNDKLEQGAASSDAVIHLGFEHDFANFERVCAQDKTAIQALCAGLAGTKKPFISTSGTLGIAQYKPATEDDEAAKVPNPRYESENVPLTLSAEGKVNAFVMRLPPTNHGDGDKGFVDILINTAKGKGKSAYFGDGSNRWPATHVSDTAKAYVAALEYAAGSSGSGIGASRKGRVFHVVAEEGVAFKAMAEAIGQKLGLPAVSLSTMEELQNHFGWFAWPAAADNLVSSQKTRETLGWKPCGVSLIEDVKHGKYFD